jgi:PRTRC genetic system protein B
MNLQFKDIGLAPVLAMVAYQLDDGSLYAESMRVGKNGQLTKPVPLKKSTFDTILQTAAASSNKTVRPRGIIPQEVIYSSVSSLVWVREPKYTELNFKFKNKSLKGKAFTPRLVFRYQNKEFKVFAIRDGKLEPGMQLFYTPFHNCYADGRVCMGSARLKAAWYMQDIIRNVEDAFFSSYFTHSNNTSGIKGDMDEFWVEHLKTKDLFPVEKLNNSNRKLKSLLV